jgi:hypothetical protein
LYFVGKKHRNWSWIYGQNVRNNQKRLQRIL